MDEGRICRKKVRFPLELASTQFTVTAEIRTSIVFCGSLRLEYLAAVTAQ